jgi:hypothetical protein
MLYISIIISDYHRNRIALIPISNGNNLTALVKKWPSSTRTHKL